MKAAEDRWVNAAVRRSDIIFAEQEEKRRKTLEENPPPAEEATLTGGASWLAGPEAVRRSACEHHEKAETGHECREVGSELRDQH